MRPRWTSRRTCAWMRSDRSRRSSKRGAERNRIMKPIIPAALCTALLLSACALLERPRPPPNRALSKTDEGLLLHKTEGLPDIRRGVLSAKAGRFDEAQRDLQPLAEHGYLAAQLALGRVYSHLDPPDWPSSIKWFRLAYVQNPQQADVPLGRALGHSDDESALQEAQRLLQQAYAQRQDVGALAGLI